MSENKTENIESNNNKQLGSIGQPLIIHKPRKKAPIRRHTVEIITGIIILAVVVTISFCLHEIFTTNDENNNIELSNYPIADNDSISKQLSQLGKIKLNGRLGSVPTIFEIDFRNQIGCRYSTFSSTTNYLLKIHQANINPDNSFHIIFTDYFEGNIAIGRFDGTLSEDGSTFNGEYTSQYGKVIKFTFEE
ncbi:MAG: hypothetical protein K2O43_00175 [Muribaculaceae bacterium]|nr:hypothetical protein [Muribaculaceae bacterium]